METVLQKYLRNEFATIHEYNAQAGEVAEQPLDFVSLVMRLQHVIANKTIEALDVLHRHGLVEHVHRLTADAGQPCKPAVVLDVLFRRAVAMVLKPCTHFFGARAIFSAHAFERVDDY